MNMALESIKNTSRFSTFNRKSKTSILKLFESATFYWACDGCLLSHKAIESNFKIITARWFPPLAFFDIRLSCVNCNANFTFTKEEQKHWYETLQFNIHSISKHCNNCRKVIRTEKKDQLILMDFLKRVDKLNKDELLKLSDIYKRLGKESKSNQYKNLAKKKE